MSDISSHLVQAGLGISGYNGKAQDGSDLCVGMGCTIAGFNGSYNITCIEFALAIRVAAKTKTDWATYVIHNLGRLYTSTRKDYLLAAGWEVIAEMPGAHPEKGSYISYLMGAKTLTREEAEEFLEKSKQPAAKRKKLCKS